MDLPAWLYAFSRTTSAEMIPAAWWLSENGWVLPKLTVNLSSRGLSKILCNRVPGRRLSIYPETP